MLRTKLFVHALLYSLSIWGTMFYTCIRVEVRKKMFLGILISVNKEYADENPRTYILKC